MYDTPTEYEFKLKIINPFEVHDNDELILDSGF